MMTEMSLTGREEAPMADCPSCGEVLPAMWTPDWCVHPGEIISDELDERGWHQTDLVALTGFTPKHINQVIKGKAHIGPAFALAMEEAFGVSAQTWMNLQTMWDLAQARAAKTGRRERGEA